MPRPDLRTTAVVFPFDLFGNAGTGAGAQLLGDVLREVIADTHAETRAIRTTAFADRLRIVETDFNTPDAVAQWRATGQALARKTLAARERLVWLSGNHLGVLPVFDSLPPETLVVQFDAHLDIYHLRDCTKELSHGNFLRHLIAPHPSFVNLGSRDLFLMPRYIRQTFDEVYAAETIITDPARVQYELSNRVAAAPMLWLDLDVDVFDPVYLPAVHQPMPFGLDAPTMLKLLRPLLDHPNLLGISISEYDPGRDTRDQSLNLLGWLLEWLLLTW